MPLNLGTQFEADVAALAGVPVYDPGTMDIALLNPNGDTTVRFTVAVNVDTTKLKAIVGKYSK